MAGDRQSASGTSFDPSPQLWVYQIEHGQLAAVTGRCLFAPVTVGMRFDTVAVKHADQWQESPCCLHVEEISDFHRLVDELEQAYSRGLSSAGTCRPAWPRNQSWSHRTAHQLATGYTKVSSGHGDRGDGSRYSETRSTHSNDVRFCRRPGEVVAPDLRGNAWTCPPVGCR